MYKTNATIVSAEGMEIVLNHETEAVVRWHHNNYYFDCSKCKKQSIGDDSGTQYDCNNCAEVEAYEQTKQGHYKYYCANYEKDMNR